MSIRNGLWLCLNLVFLARSAFGQEVENGNFELGNVGFSSDAAYVETGLFSGNFGEYSVRSNPATANGVWCGADHTSGSGLMLICDGISGSETVAWRQTVATVPGVVYSFRAWTMNLVCTQHLDNPVIVLRADAAMVAGPITLPEAPGLWVPIEGIIEATGTATTLEIVTTSSSFNGNDFAIDDIQMMPSAAVSGPQLYFVTGTSNGVGFSYGVSLGNANPVMFIQPGLPAGSDATAFAVAFAAGINASYPGIFSAVSPGPTGAPNSFEISTVPPGPAPFRFWVGGASGVPSCLVTGSSCSFNPTVTYMVGPEAPIPTVSQWGLVVLTLLLLTAATIVFARRRTEMTTA